MTNVISKSQFMTNQRLSLKLFNKSFCLKENRKHKF